MIKKALLGLVLLVGRKVVARVVRKAAGKAAEKVTGKVLRK